MQREAEEDWRRRRTDCVEWFTGYGPPRGIIDMPGGSGTGHDADDWHARLGPPDQTSGLDLPVFLDVLDKISRVRIRQNFRVEARQCGL